MRQLALKLLIIVEVVFCFVPALVLLLLGLFLVPLQLVSIQNEPLLWRGPVYLISSVAFGIVGLFTMVFVLWKVFRGAVSIKAPELVSIGAVLGALPIVPMAVFGDPWGWKVVGILPLAVSAHVLFLARRLVFPSRRVVYRSIAVALMVAALVPLAFLLNPLATTRSTILDRRNLWESVAPDRYEYIIQLSGWLEPDALSPKRIAVDRGNVVSATYVWDGFGHKAGDPAPREDLWTIDRVFTELVAAQEKGWSASVRFDERWGFVERAFVEESLGASSVWDVEVRNFQVQNARSDAME